MAKKEIFISYGRNTYDFLVFKFVEDLRKTGEFQIFFDTEVLNLGDWEKQITHGIERCEYFIYLVSQKSTSLDGYCLNELSFAAELKKTIIPICLDDSYLPLSITRLQRLFLKKAFTEDHQIIESVYQPVFDRVLRILRNEEELGFYLQAFDIATEIQTRDAYEIGHYTRLFFGRKTFFEDFKKWLENPNSLPIYLLQAAPGVGKSAISAMLTLKFSENVAAIHFCVDKNKDKTDAKNIIKNLVAQLAYRNEEYANFVRDVLKNKKETDNELDAKRLFEMFILEIGNKIQFPQKQVFVIDALDEAIVNGKNEIAEILVSYQNTLPSWLKFFCTSRNQRDVLVYFSNSHRFAIDENSEDNYEDLKSFYKHEFGVLSEKKYKILLEKTHGSFLYASKIINRVKAGELTLDNVSSFPNGIYEYYIIWFNRIFKSPEEYEPLKKIISLLLVCSVSPTIPFLSEATGMDDDLVLKHLNKVSDFFQVNDEQLKASHKSVLDWLRDDQASPEMYRVSAKSGYQLLEKYIINKKSSSPRLWKRDPYVILDYQNALRGLNKIDDLIDLMMDADYLSACLDSHFYTLYEGLSSYIANIGYLYKEDAEFAFEIYHSDCFTYIFSTYREHMYHSGLFIKLNDYGFTKFLKHHDPSDNLNYDLGVIQYFYISQHYKEAYQSLQEFVKDHELSGLDAKIRCEAERTAMLIYRKLVLFDEIEKLSPATIKDATDAHDLHEASLAYLTLSKIFCRQLKKEESYKAGEEAIRLLNIRVDEQDGKIKVAEHLFLAEYYRVYADACIWLKDFEKAKESLTKAEAIYAYYNQIDRYHTRYLYTSLFAEIATKVDEEKIMDLYEQAMESANENNDKYDRGQVYFLLAMYYFINNKKSKNYLSLALENAQKAVEIDDQLSIYLEALEAKCLYNLIAFKMGEEAKYKDTYNSYTDKWIEYVEKFIKDLED